MANVTFVKYDSIAKKLAPSVIVSVNSLVVAL
jgi:hypothetical protein